MVATAFCPVILLSSSMAISINFLSVTAPFTPRFKQILVSLGPQYGMDRITFISDMMLREVFNYIHLPLDWTQAVVMVSIYCVEALSIYYHYANLIINMMKFVEKGYINQEVITKVIRETEKSKNFHL